MEKRLESNRFLSIIKSKIARRFTLHVVSFSLLIALIISTLTIYKSYHEDLNRLNKELIQIEQSIKSSLTYNLWQMNFDAIDILTNDLLMNKYIVYVSLFDEKGNLLIEKGVKTQENAINKTIPIYYHQPNQENIYLGKLNYIATTKYIYEKHIRSAFSAIISIIIFFLLLSIVIVYLYWNSTVKYLLAIKDYTNKLRVGSYKDEVIDDLVLDRSFNKDEKDELDELVDAINDMRREIVEKYATIEYQSLHDALTGLPNRRMINKLIAETIVRCRETKSYGALFYVDLDQFKLVNDSLGHTVGDKILLEISKRLTNIMGKEYQPARIAGDEFLILQKKLIDDREKAKAEALEYAHKILKSISKNIIIDNNNIKITACIGIALFGGESNTEIIIKQADNALYNAKEKGRNQIAFFAPSMQKTTERRLQLEQLISIAVEKDLLFVNYQPKYDYQNNIYSAEALVRLHDEKGNIVSPGEFIPIAEESGNIIKIGDYVIKKVFSFINKNRLDFEKSGIKSIAINVSPTQYSAPGFVDMVVDYAKQFKIDPSFIILEITEEVVAGSIDTVLDVMKRLKKHGFKFSIDDFGTGYSSLRYLRNFPLDELKIDKSFVDDVLEDEKAVAIVKTIIDMAHNLKFNVVAEGVENEKQLNILRGFGCESYQGYLFSRPLSEKDLLDKLKRNKKK